MGECIFTGSGGQVQPRIVPNPAKTVNLGGHERGDDAGSTRAGISADQWREAVRGRVLTLVTVRVASSLVRLGPAGVH
jgi:hypothetical protein